MIYFSLLQLAKLISIYEIDLIGSIFSSIVDLRNLVDASELTGLICVISNT